MFVDGEDLIHVQALGDHGLFGRLVGRYRGALLEALGILLYTLLIGAGASEVGAALMFG